MNAITYAIQRIRKTGIPKEVLEMAFLSRFSQDYRHNLPVDTLESRIREEVFKERVCIDLNIVNTVQMTIPLSKCERLSGGFMNAVYRVPMELTQGKAIVTVLHLTTSAAPISIDSDPNADATSGSAGGFPNLATTISTSNNSVLGVMQQVTRSVSPVQLVSNALCYIVGLNTIMVRDVVLNPGYMQLRVEVEMDENMNHIQRPYYTVIYKLALLACKSIIYNKLIIAQDQSFIHSGGELNKFRDVIEEYRDAEEQYEEYLEEALKSMLLNDNESSRRHYQSRVGGGW